MARWPQSAWVLVLLAGCAFGAPGRTTGGVNIEGTVVGPKISSAPILKASYAPSSPRPGSFPQAKREALVNALHNFVAAGRATQLTAAVRTAGGIISNNGSGILSDNGLGLIGNNSGSYHTLADSTYTAETELLLYVITPFDEKTGEFKAYDKAAYKAATTDADKEKALIDHFKWDDVTITPSGAPPTLTVDVAYHLKMVSSKRLPATDRLVSRERHRVTYTDPLAEPEDTIIGWEIEFAMDVLLLDGVKDTASFKGVAGENDITFTPASDGTPQAFPNRLAITGTHANGTFEGDMAGKDYPTTNVTHVEKGTKKETELKVEFKPDGAIKRTIDLPDQKMRVVMTVDAKGLGSGQLFDTSTGTPTQLGTIAWDDTGLGTVTLPDTGILGDQNTFQVRVF